MVKHRRLSSHGGLSSPGVSTYLPMPQHSLRGVYHETLMRLTYDIWQREIRRFDRQPSDHLLKVLECGCGPGLLLKFLEKWFPTAELVGLDLDGQILDSARERTMRTRFVCGSAEGIPLPDETFDLLIALHVVEHLPQPLRFIREAQRVLRRGGLLIIATPNPSGVGAHVMGKRWVGWKDDSHVSLNPPDYWSKQISEQGFHILREGTTGLSGIPIFRVLPIALLNWVPLFAFGFFPWMYGESYICMAKADSSSPMPTYSWRE